MQWINTYIGLHLQAAHASLRKLWCNPLLTFSTILTITATLFLPTILLAIASNIDKFVLNLQQKNNINLYL